MIFAESDRLLLRNFKSEDLDIFIRYRNDTDISKYQSWKNISRDEGILFIEDQKNLDLSIDNNWLQIAIEEKKSKQLIGDCAIKFFDQRRQADIGITISLDYQHRGFAKEALSALFNLVFYKNNLHRIIAIIDVDNISSISLIKKLGFRREAKFIKSYYDNGIWRDEYQFAILNEEWNLTSK